MRHRALALASLAALPILAVSLLGCSEDDAPPLHFPSDDNAASDPGTGVDFGNISTSDVVIQDEEQKAAILRQVIQLIQTAATNAGGDNFTLAAESLNDYFLGSDPKDFELDPRVRAFLEAQPGMPPNAGAGILNPKFTGQLDGRHIEDCMMYRYVTRSVLSRAQDAAVSGDDLAKARSLFDWIVSQIVLVPAGSLAAPNARTPDGQPFQAQARPYDVLLRGMATETGGLWAERTWLFLALCRQAQLDAALLEVVVPVKPPMEQFQSSIFPSPHLEPTAPTVRVFCSGVRVGDSVYLFDARLGQPILTADGRSVATLEQAATDPEILARLNLAERPYPVSFADLATGKVRVLLDADIGSLSPRMKRLQERLTGENRMILYEDPSVLAGAFQEVMGDRFESARLWTLPLEVEYRLFHDSQFNAASGFPVQIFNARWPLLPARLDQLRGDLDTAVKRYVSFRYAEALLEADGKTVIDPRIQHILDMYATHFLGLAQLDRGWTDQAKDQFLQTLKFFPEPAGGKPPYLMFRWGAKENLARLMETQGRPKLAVRYLTDEPDGYLATGDLLKARDLLWAHPFAPESPDEVPNLPAPPDSEGPDSSPANSSPKRLGLDR